MNLKPITGSAFFPGFWLALTLACGQSLAARDAFVLLSGGDTPLENNYSQYLQARAVVAWFQGRYPPESIWVFFGAGNVEGDPPLFGDVRRKVRREGLTVDSWLPGALPRNRPARRSVILQALREEILPSVANGGTLYLFVGDHGSRTRGDQGESILNLWSLERDPRSESGWRSNDDESLGVTELRRTLAQGLGKGRLVFCMTQCHSGGFHHLAVPRQMTPNPRWFARIPDWAAPTQPVLPRAAGFTATDEFSAAAGCDADPNPDEWAGYERYVPEQLFGMDLFTLQRSGKGRNSFAEAHAAATLLDATIDKPCSTSDQYLDGWARLIETRLAAEPTLTAKVRQQVAAYQRMVDGAPSHASDRSFRERQALFRRFIERLGQQNPAAVDLLRRGSRRELEEAIGPTRERDRRPGRRRRRAQAGEVRKLWDESVRPAWKSGVEAGQVRGVPAAALEFEKYLLKQEAGGRDYLFGDADALDDEVFWRSGYSNPQTLIPEKAEAITRWAAERRTRILAWASHAEDDAVRAAADKLSELRARRRSGSDPTAPPGGISEKVAAERTLYYRRVLAAWNFLLALDERPALARLRELIELERTPFPRPK